MAKVKTDKKVSERQKYAIVTDANGMQVAVIEPRYKMVPVDFPTHDDLLELCRLRGFGKRGQGAMMRILVKDALAKAQSKLKEKNPQ